MKKKLTTVEFHGTKAQEEELYKVIEELRDTKGAMMPILQKAQGIYGYLPVEVMKMISDKTGVSLEEIYGIASFYAQFSLNPKGKHAIAVCLGTACYVKGAADVLNRISLLLGLEAGNSSKDGKYSLEATRCIGACGLAPVMTIGDDVYGKVKKEDVDDILAKYAD